MTSSLLRVSAFLAAFTGLYFAVSIIEDTMYHRVFFDRIGTDVRQALAVRLVYRTIKEHASARPQV